MVTKLIVNIYFKCMDNGNIGTQFWKHIYTCNLYQYTQELPVTEIEIINNIVEFDIDIINYGNFLFLKKIKN